MTNSNLSLAALVGSRICHDLISPVGAINNGIELIAMGGPVDTPELSLISDSVHDASARIKFFRIAFGVASEAQVLGTPEVAGIIKGVYGTGRHHATMSATGDMPRAEVQAVFLAMLCAESALPVGGNITVSRNGGWKVHAAGSRIAADPQLWEPLSLGRMPGTLKPAMVQFGLLPQCLQEMGRAAQVILSETEATITF